MNTRVTIICLAVLICAASAWAQTQRTEVVVKKEYEISNFYSMRAGLWFPKDHEKQFTFENTPFDNAKTSVDQSQAFGLDFDFRKEIGTPLYFDMAVQLWYSSYDFKYSAVSTENITDANAWAVIIPLTAGLTVAPLPGSPVQPYAMAGVGAYIGITGQQVNYNGNHPTHNANRQKIAFGGYIGAGLDLFLSSKFALSGAVKYNIIEFSEMLFTQQKEFTGLQILLGITTAL